MSSLLPLLLACADAPPPADVRGDLRETVPVAAPVPARVDPEPGMGVMDGLPGRRTVSASGEVVATVAPGGRLTVTADGVDRVIDELVDARVTFSPDDAWLVYARRGGLDETDLWRVALPDGTPEPITAWRGSEDRPVFSPDGTALAFVSGRTGMASWWRVDLGTLPVAEDAGVQLTNVDLVRLPGQPPVGYTPPPDAHEYAWTVDGLSWVAEGQRYTAPTGQP